TPVWERISRKLCFADVVHHLLHTLLETEFREGPFPNRDFERRARSSRASRLGRKQRAEGVRQDRNIASLQKRQERGPAGASRKPGTGIPVLAALGLNPE